LDGLLRSAGRSYRRHKDIADFPLGLQFHVRLVNRVHRVGREPAVRVQREALGRHAPLRTRVATTPLSLLYTAISVASPPARRSFRYHPGAMPTERIQKKINALLDEAEAAVTARDWATVQARAESILAYDPTDTTPRRPPSGTCFDERREALASLSQRRRCYWLPLGIYST
jgi:hypothetical protein